MTNLDSQQESAAWPRQWLAAIVLAATVLRLWRLDRSGYGNQYYAAGVRSMVESWHNFFFNAFDPNGFVSLDKPPVAFWIQAATAKLLGFGGFAILMPQALEGIAAVVLLYVLISKAVGQTAGLLAAFFLAITPISVAVDRSNNTDTGLVLVLMLAAWALIRATRTGSRPWLLGAAALVGVAFNVKMLAAFIVVPTFVLAYFVSAPVSRRRRIGDLALAGAILGVVSLSWTVVYDLTPADQRPYAGSSTNNSMLELVIGHNGLQRFLSRTDTEAGANAAATAAAQAAFGVPIAAAPPGPLRLADPRLADQVGWLLPLALLGAGIWARRAWLASRLKADPDLIVWAGWAATYAVVYSGLARLSPYYLVTLGPPLSALAGVGVAALWSWLKHRRRIIVAGGVLLLTADWQIYVERGYFRSGLAEGSPNLAGPEDWSIRLSLIVMTGTILALAGLAAARWMKTDRPFVRTLATTSFLIGLVTLLADPFAWAVSGMLAGNVQRPLANPAVLEQAVSSGASDDGDQRRGGRGRGLQDDRKLVAFLEANHGDERFLLATLSARQAAPVIIQTGQPVAALGGFSGTDPIVSPDALAGMVDAGQLRFVMVGGDRGAGAFAGAREQEAALSDWVKAHGMPVDPALWRAPQPINRADAAVRARRRFPGNGPASPLELYDLKADAGEKTPPAE